MLSLGHLSKDDDGLSTLLTEKVRLSLVIVLAMRRSHGFTLFTDLNYYSNTMGSPLRRPLDD